MSDFQKGGDGISFTPDNCPPGLLSITASDEISCNETTRTVYLGPFLYFSSGGSQNLDSTWQYTWQEQVGNTFVNVSQPSSYNSYPQPSYVVDMTKGPKTIRLVATDANGCVYYSNVITLTRNEAPKDLVLGPSTEAPIYTGGNLFFTIDPGYYSYQWSVSGPNGYSQLFGFNSSTNISNPLYPNVAGQYVISVVVCSFPNCCTTFTYNLNVLEGCPNPPKITNVAFTECTDIKVSISGGANPKTYTAKGTYIDKSGTIQSQATTIFIDTNVVPAGETDKVTITITDANGCKDEKTIKYMRCACMCNISNACTVSYQKQGFTSFNDIIGSFKKGSKFCWGFQTGSDIPQRMKLFVNNKVVLDTGKVNWLNDKCGCTVFCGCTDIFLGNYTNSTVNLIVGQGEVGPANNKKCPINNTIPYSCDFFPGDDVMLKGEITLEEDGELRIEVESNSCGTPSFVRAKLKCC
jgi:hypothetical protein